jgi:hypothetical protein
MQTATKLAIATAIAFSATSGAHAASKSFDLGSFDRIDIATGLDAQVSQGDSFAIIAESGSQDALDNLQLSVVDGVLTARLDQSFLDFILSGGLVGMLLNSGNAVTVNITLPALVGVTASSGADVRGAGINGAVLDLDASSGADIELTGIAVGALGLNASSGADISVSGTAGRVDADASSGAGIDAENLIAANASAQTSSGADISVHATQAIKAEASSGGDVEVHGSPTTRDVDASSGGDIEFDD